MYNSFHAFHSLNFFATFLFSSQPIQRVQRKFNPLRIPKKLQKDLPFKSKPKDEKKQKKKTYVQKRAVVMETDEKKVSMCLFIYWSWLARISLFLFIFYFFKFLEETGFQNTSWRFKHSYFFCPFWCGPFCL